MPGLTGLGAVLAGQGDLEGAEATLRRALGHDPEAAQARFNLAQVLERGEALRAEAAAEYRAGGRGREGVPELRAAAPGPACTPPRYRQAAASRARTWTGERGGELVARHPRGRQTAGLRTGRWLAQNWNRTPNSACRWLLGMIWVAVPKLAEW